MGWILATSNLYVTCKDQEQCRKLIAEFRNEDPDRCKFYLHLSTEKPLKVAFELEGGEVPSDFDDIVINMDKWLRSRFGLTFEGYWWSEIDCDEYRSEIHDGEVKDAYLGWLKQYTIEQIEKIRQYAETTFPSIPYNQQ